MINNYSKYIIIICVMVGFLIPKKFSSLQNKLTNEQRQIIAQANSLEKSGLIDEAIIAYQDILNKFPTLKTALLPARLIPEKGIIEFFKQNPSFQFKIEF